MSTIAHERFSFINDLNSGPRDYIPNMSSLLSQIETNQIVTSNYPNPFNPETTINLIILFKVE